MQREEDSHVLADSWKMCRAAVRGEGGGVHQVSPEFTEALGYSSGQLVMRGMSQLRPTFAQLPLSVILSGVRSRRLSAVYPTIDLPSLTPEEDTERPGVQPARMVNNKKENIVLPSHALIEDGENYA